MWIALIMTSVLSRFTDRKEFLEHLLKLRNAAVTQFEKYNSKGKRQEAVVKIKTGLS